jgi:hypothetical protein
MVYKLAWSIKNYRYVWDVSGSAPSPRALENAIGDAGREAMGMGRGSTEGNGTSRRLR